jgi:hypothetical protein
MVSDTVARVVVMIALEAPYFDDHHFAPAHGYTDSFPFVTVIETTSAKQLRLAAPLPPPGHIRRWRMDDKAWVDFFQGSLGRVQVVSLIDKLS